LRRIAGPKGRRCFLVYQPVLLDGFVSADDEAKRQSALKSCQPGLRLSLCHAAGSVDPGVVAVSNGDERIIGYLPRDVGEWVGPLLDDEKAAFDAEIWSVEEISAGSGPQALSCHLLLTQHDLIPVARFALVDWLFGSRETTEPVAVPRGVRDSG
jgi:hypothetical protein